MITNYEKYLLTDVMNKIGLTDLFNKNIPVIDAKKNNKSSM